MKVPFLDLHSQYLRHQQELNDAMTEVLKQSAFIGGEEVQAFEQEFTKWLGVEHCIGCGNGTDALEILLEAMGIGPGDEVIVPAMTWISTAEAVTRTGACPVFADVLPNFYTLDPQDVARKITSHTRAMIPVHLYGQPAEMNELQALAKDHGLKIVEDCAQAHGATYRGTHIGTIGDAAAFSFYPGKNLGAYGDAGAMVTADADLAEKARMLACHGQQAKHDHHLEGRNSRLDGLQAAVLRVKLGHLTEWIQIRRHTAAQYYQELANLPLLLPATQLYAEHAYHLFVVQTEHRDNLASELKNQGISTGIHYPKALPYTYVYQQRFRHTSEDFPTAYDMQSRILSLPIGDHMTEELTHQVIRATIEALV